MPILYNQGRTIPELPSLNSGNISNSDYLLIQNVASNSTKKSTVSEFAVKSATLISAINNLKFTGPNNQFTGSIRNTDGDNYSSFGTSVPNILKRLKVTDYLEVGSVTKTTSCAIYTSIFSIDQSAGGNISIIGASNSDIIINNYPIGLNLLNTPLYGESITATSGFTGDLTGNVTGDIDSSVESTFNDVNISGILSSVTSVLSTVDIAGGNINGTTIGLTSAARIIGTQITASTGFKGNLKGDVTGNLTGDVTSNLINATTIIGGTYYGNVEGGTVIASGFAGDLTGDVKTPLGNIVLQNGPGPANQSSFYGTASYSRNGSNFSSYSSSYSLRSSYAVSSSHSITASYAAFSYPNLAKSASVLVWSPIRSNGTSSYSFNGLNKLSSFSSSYAITSSHASSSVYSYSSKSASYALKALTIDDNASVFYADNAGYASLSNIANTSSYLYQVNNESYKFTYFDGEKLINSPYFSYQYISGYDQYYLSSSHPAGYLLIDSKAYGYVPPPNESLSGFVESALVLSNNYNRGRRAPTYNWGPEGWRFIVSNSGSLSLTTLTGSYQFNNPNYVPKGIYPYFSALKQVNNAFYFWSEPFSYSSVSRDASIGIGVPSPTSAKSTPTTKGKLHIIVFSSSLSDLTKGSWDGDATVRQQDAAIYIEYGSSSFDYGTNVGVPFRRTFTVSGSGNTFIGGNLYVQKGITGSFIGAQPFRSYRNSAISFWGTGSQAVSSSVSVRSFSSSYAVTSSHVPLLSETIYSNISFANFTWDTSDGGTQTAGGTAYSFKPLTNANGKLLKYFRIEGSIKAVPSAAGYFINGVKIGGPSGTLVNGAKCSWGWGRTFTPTTSDYRIPFTIEGQVPVDYATGTVQFTIYAPSGIQNYLEGYVVGFY